MLLWMDGWKVSHLEPVIKPIWAGIALQWPVTLPIHSYLLSNAAGVLWRRSASCVASQCIFDQIYLVFLKLQKNFAQNIHFFYRISVVFEIWMWPLKTIDISHSKFMTIFRRLVITSRQTTERWTKNRRKIWKVVIVVSSNHCVFNVLTLHS